MSSSFAAAAKILLLFCLANLWIQVENKAVFGIGTRIAGDQLLMKDILKTPSITLTEETVIRFNYAIPQPITFIEMISEKDIYGTVNFSYENDLVNGTIHRGMPGIISGLGHQPEAFEVLIHIYGFNNTQSNENPSYILNKHQQQFNGILRPSGDGHLPQDALSLMKDDSIALEHFDDEDAYDALTDNYYDDDYDDDDYNEDSFNSSLNKIIELGSRQEGDSLLYDTYQTSSDVTKVPTNHTVVFYYIDVNFITFVQITLFDHFKNNPLTDYRPPSIEFEKISPHTLKAIVTDQNTTSLFAQIEIYGFKPNDKPVAFQSYWTSGQASTFSVADDVTDVEDITIHLPATDKQRVRVHFNRKGEAGCSDGAAIHHLAIFNWLSSTVVSLTVVMIWRQIVY